MNILVFNCGSSSLTFKVYRHGEGASFEELVVGKARRVGVKGDKPATLEYSRGGRTVVEDTPLPSHRTAAIRVIEALERLGVGIDRIGHRWPNGMDHFSTAVITPALMPTLRGLVPLIPIHHSISLAVITECRRRFPTLLQYVTTDNACHKNLPPRAYRYALPRSLSEERGIRKIGFHGLSFQYVAERAPAILGIAPEKLKMVVCHLGTGGSEIAAMDGGISVDVSMGYTGLPGVMMSTRAGDVDGLLPIYLMRAFDLDVDDVQDVLNNMSGLIGVSGTTSDLRDLLERRSRGEPEASLAVDMYVRGVKKFIGAFTAALRGLDCLVFTDDIGANSPEIRALSCAGLEFMGIELDGERNRALVPEGGAFLESARSRVRVLAIPTDEELVMAEAGALLNEEAV